MIDINSFATHELLHSISFKQAFNTVELESVPFLELLYNEFQIPFWEGSVLFFPEDEFLVGLLQNFVWQETHVLLVDYPYFHFGALRYD